LFDNSRHYAAAAEGSESQYEVPSGILVYGYFQYARKKMLWCITAFSNYVGDVSKLMRVVFLTHDYPPFTFGGVGSFVENLARQLSRMGVRTTVVCGYPAQSKIERTRKDEEEHPGIDVLRFPYPRLPPRHTFFQVMNLQRIRETLKDLQGDVIHGQSGSTFPASIVLRGLAPIVVTFHGSPEANKTIGIHSLTRGGGRGDFWTYVLGYPAWSFGFRMELRHSNMSVAVSKSLRSELLAEMGNGYAKKLCTIPNGIDIDELDSRYEHFGNTVEERGDTIIFAGRLFYVKRPLDLVRMAALFRRQKRDLKLIVHGTGPLLGRLRSDVRELGLRNMKVEGFSDVGGLMRSMKRSSFVVLPSVWEACPMIILEAMCLGKIPVMLDLPYARELTNDGEYGILARDVDDMVTRINAICDAGGMEDLQKRIRSYARANFDAERMARQYLRLYEKVSK
jgi:glycosyltransferase involved in cell wall biosynthesis